MTRSRVWLVSCFESALGQAIAEQALVGRDTVVIPSHLGGTNVLLQKYPGSCVAVPMDLTDANSCIDAVSEALKIVPRIDIVVNYAPTQLYVGAVEEVELAHLHDQLEVSLYPIVNVTQAVVPVMMGQQSGHVINLVDVHGMMGSAMLGLVTSALHAVEGYSESLALSLGPYGVRVTIVETALDVSVGTNPLKFVPTSTPYNNDPTCDKSRAILSSINVFPEDRFSDAVTAVVDIAGTRDPPSRIVAGLAPTADVKEYLNALSDEVDQLKFDMEPDTVQRVEL